MADLQPPRKSVELEDPGAHELDSTDGEDHFSDAVEGMASAPDRDGGCSPVPTTRVERVDDEPSHGEVPGTSAYDKRKSDAVPDEIEVVPEGQRSRAVSRADIGTPLTPGGTPIPKMIVEKVDPDSPSHGDVPGTDAHEKRKADAVPDLIVQAPKNAREPLHGDDDDGDRDKGEGDEGFGDDFDDFEVGGGDDDFGDFDDGFQEPVTPDPIAEPPRQAPPVLDAPPIPNFDDVDSLDDIIQATAPYMEKLFPSLNTLEPVVEELSDPQSVFLSERSVSLWSQLVAPPPLQPPNWVRSRIRRLFLVSLGVPVDLDEILPASKQKKLVLPSLNADRSPRPSTDERANGAVARLKKENDSTASVNSTSSKAERKRRGPPPPPELDINSTGLLCNTTEAALRNFTDEELQAHVQRLEQLQTRAKEVLEYWVKRTDSALGDKEAFEGVIENLVQHAKKLRS